MNAKWQQLATSLLAEAGQRHPSEMLDKASDLYARHGCNDYDFPDDWTLDDRRAFVRLYHEWNGDPEEYNPDYPDLPDFAVMGFLAAMSRSRR